MLGPVPDFTIVLRGYDRAEVDRYLTHLGSLEPGESPPPPTFGLVVRGYEKTQVDAYINRLRGARALAPPTFTIGLRGYDVGQVNEFVEQAFARIAELERTVDRLTSAE